ncbi:M15 family metallopeptidase [Yoonia sp.]|uniref:M15 family metallopeptidase n=1 Tax=Yoonia sp. TaxID=2212373 RepID=UPI003F4ADE37
MIDTTDPRGSEALVDIGKSGIAVLPFYHVADGSNAPYGHRIKGSLSRMWCRESLLPMLLSANETLAAFKCELVVYDAYRSIATQNGIWAWALDKTKTDHPNLSQLDLEALTSQYSSDPRRFNPTDATTWPTHATGASIDVMLRSLVTGETLDMGAAFDDLSPVAQTDYLEQQLGRNLISYNDAALIHRRILYWAMIGAGFANYSGEYWHFDFGNQMYVLSTSAQNAPLDRAWYGYCVPPE